jgi:hypothetical protein
MLTFWLTADDLHVLLPRPGVREAGQEGAGLRVPAHHPQEANRAQRLQPHRLVLHSVYFKKMP